ncbi:MAG TPA: hypothetical protein VE027_08090 [Acidimicrobiia bacterium]|nr:hypothetical protein [Acidimicrobiia bacterium]
MSIRTWWAATRPMPGTLRRMRSPGQTALNVSAEAVDRWGSIFSVVWKQFAQTGHVSAEGPLRLTEAASQVGESTHAEIDEAEAWLIGHDGVGGSNIGESPNLLRLAGDHELGRACHRDMPQSWDIMSMATVAVSIRIAS